jgi:hypothetical protein
VKLGGYGRDVIDGLLIAAISQANVAQITRSPDLQLRYATVEAVPPDEIRRPVSINAVATSLHIPFETARRRIAALAKSGRAQIGPAGVIIPTAPLISPTYRIAVEANSRLVSTLYQRLRHIGLLRDLPRAVTPYEGDAPPHRLVIRLSSDYVLRLAEPVTQNMGDLVAGLILMDVIQANTEHLPDDERGESALDPNGFLPDHRRRPVRVAFLSERLGIAQETVRRHLARLIEEDRCERTPDGYIVPSRVLARPLFMQYMADNQVNLQRLFHALAEYGVTDRWDREAPALRGAA